MSKDSYKKSQKMVKMMILVRKDNYSGQRQTQI